MNQYALSDGDISQLRCLAEEFDLDFLVLFGSHAKNAQKSGSDVDLAFLKQEMDKDEEFALYEALDTIFEGAPYDLINLEQQFNVVLRFHIFWYGICLYEKEPRIFEREKEYSYFDYIDSFALLQPNKEKFLSKPL